MAHNEQIFTPNYIVEDILDRIGYYVKNCDTSKVRKKHIIDNSCGNGAFLKVIVERYINACITDNLSDEEIAKELETYIHGIEIDNDLRVDTFVGLQRICEDKGIEPQFQINFDITCQDAMTCDYYNRQMDYVVGNPPYCKVHDLKEKYDKVKEFNFAQGGMTDLYLVFFEIGINMLNETGKLGYITPNSWMTSKAGNNFRKWLKETKKLSEIVQFGSYKVFEEATTFTNITIIDNSKTHNYFYYSYDIDEISMDGDLNMSFINNNFYIGDDYALNTIDEVTNPFIYHKIKVKNGFATLNDKLFIQQGTYDKKLTQDYPNVIEMYKASTGKTYNAIYPYDKAGKPMKFEELDEYAKTILASQLNEQNIVDNLKDNWYLYGRNQGIKDMSKYRIAITNLINDDLISVKIKLLEPYVGIYSGLYIVCEDDKYFIEDNYKKIYDLLVNFEFINYVKALGKFKNGGYYTFSSKDLENYINFKIDF